jgi:hypothetical protein
MTVPALPPSIKKEGSRTLRSHRLQGEPAGWTREGSVIFGAPDDSHDITLNRVASHGDNSIERGAFAAGSDRYREIPKNARSGNQRRDSRIPTPSPPNTRLAKTSNPNWTPGRFLSASAKAAALKATKNTIPHR